MSGYESVARQLETVAKIRAAANTGSKLRNKQRKWKIYLSICLLLPALAAIIGIVAWAISIEVASTNSIHMSSNSNNNHKDFQQHKNLQQHQHQQKTPQSLVFHQFKRHQAPPAPPSESSENSILSLGPKGVELSDTRGSKPVAAAVISSFAKLRNNNIAIDNSKSATTNNAKETFSDTTNRSQLGQSSANRIKNVANAIQSQNKNQKRSDSGWSENKSESINADTINSNSSSNNNNSNDDVESDDDDDNNQSSSNNNNNNNNSATSSQTELIKPVESSSRSKENVPSTSTTTPRIPSTTSTSTAAPSTTSSTTTSDTQAPPKPQKSSRPGDDNTAVSTSESTVSPQRSKSPNQDDKDSYSSSISDPSSTLEADKTRLEMKADHRNRVNDRMMMMMAAAIMPSDSNSHQNLHRKRPWFDGYSNDRDSFRNSELSERPRSSWSHRNQFRTQTQPQAQIRTSNLQNHRDNLDKNVDCEQQKGIEEREYENNDQQQPTDHSKLVLAVPDERIAIKSAGGSRQASRYNIIQDKMNDAFNEPSSTSTTTTSSASISSPTADSELNNADGEKQTSIDNGQSSLPDKANPESEPASSKQDKADTNSDSEPSASLSYEATPDEELKSSSDEDSASSLKDKSISSSDNNDQNDDISFQAIANAISSTLSADSLPSPGGEINDLNQSTGSNKMADDQESGVYNSMQAETGTRQNSMPTRLRQRTTGEHLAEVIDHIVERRKQTQTNHAAIQRGPQIVVVAPIDDGMRARSLTKEQSSTSTTEKQQPQTQTPVVSDELKKKPADDKRSASSMKKEAHILASSNSNKADKQQQQVISNKNKKLTRIIGARLMGTDPTNSSLANIGNSVDSKKQQPIKYSERVEVIEDDDSSSMLIKNFQDQSKLESEDSDEREFSRMDKENQQNQREIDDSLLLPLDYQSSIHVSSRPGEARSRSARHELNPNQVFERYAHLQQQDGGGGGRPSYKQSSNQAQARLYSAEQLIRDHVLKSNKLRPNKLKQQAQQVINGDDQAPMQLVQNQPERLDNRLSSPYIPAQPNIQNQPKQAPIYLSSQQQNQPHQVKTRPTTIRPQTSSAPSVQSISTSTTQVSVSPIQTTMTSTSISTSTEPSSMNQQQQVSDSRRQQAIYGNGEMDQALASNVQSVQVPMFLQNQRQNREEFRLSQSGEIFQAKESQPQIVNYQEQQQSQHQFQPKYQQSDLQQQQQQPQQQQVQQQNSLPLFADQEYNVPAHMAESVIHDIQQTSATISMVNGQPTIVNVPARQLSFSQNANNRFMSPEASNLNQQQQMMIYHNLPSQQQPQQVYQNQQRLYPMTDSWNRYQDIQRQQEQQQRQVLANRNGLETQQSAQAAPVSVSVKTPKGLIHPVAQMALRHLFNSFRDHSPLQRGRSEPASISASASAAPFSQSSEETPDQESSQSIPIAVTAQSAISPSNTLKNQQNLKQYSITDPMQVEAASLTPMQAAAPAAGAVTDLPTGRQMRSLPIGAAASSVIPQQQLLSSSQDMSTAESYNNGPTYYMGGGEGGHHYGGNNYESEHDKKSKGITFHFGGGPIGGGTQLITSPMGIFKHLMIPLLPNPRVNLNGKIVFGVVLEKNTAIGPPTKKKYKFWGK